MADTERPPGAGAEPEGQQETRSRSEEEQRFIEGLVVRGAPVPAGPAPPPPGATNEVGEEVDGVPPKVRRRRFSAHGCPAGPRLRLRGRGGGLLLGPRSGDVPAGV